MSGAICPECGSRDVEFDSDAELGLHIYNCLKCEHEWPHDYDPSGTVEKVTSRDIL